MTASPAARAERAALLAGSIGVNHVPSWTAEPQTAWGADLPINRLRFELELAAAIGFDHVRVWFDEPTWAADPARAASNAVTLLDLAHAVGLRVVAVVFDACGLDRRSPAGRRTIGEILDDPASGAAAVAGWVAGRDGGTRNQLTASALVPVEWWGDPNVVLWEGWRSNPGSDVVASGAWDGCRRYAAELAGLLAAHPTVLLAEIVNEPWIGVRHDPTARRRIDTFARVMAAAVRAAAPGLPISIAAESACDCADHEHATDVELDVVSWHCYGDGREIAESVMVASAAAGSRPRYLSEWGCFPGGDDDVQRRVVAGQIDAVLAAADAGSAVAHFHLVAGYGPFGLSALAHPSGALRPAGRELRDRLAAGRSGTPRLREVAR